MGCRERGRARGGRVRGPAPDCIRSPTRGSHSASLCPACGGSLDAGALEKHDIDGRFLRNSAAFLAGKRSRTVGACVCVCVLRSLREAAEISTAAHVNRERARARACVTIRNVCRSTTRARFPLA